MPFQNRRKNKTNKKKHKNLKSNQDCTPNQQITAKGVGEKRNKLNDTIVLDKHRQIQSMGNSPGCGPHSFTTRGVMKRGNKHIKIYVDLGCILIRINY